MSKPYSEGTVTCEREFGVLNLYVGVVLQGRSGLWATTGKISEPRFSEIWKQAYRRSEYFIFRNRGLSPVLSPRSITFAPGLVYALCPWDAYPAFTAFQVCFDDTFLLRIRRKVAADQCQIRLLKLSRCKLFRVALGALLRTGKREGSRCVLSESKVSAREGISQQYACLV